MDATISKHSRRVTDLKFLTLRSEDSDGITYQKECRSNLKVFAMMADHSTENRGMKESPVEEGGE